MRLEGFLMIVVPLALYGGLTMLPARRGYHIAGLLSALLAAAFILSAISRPTPNQFDLMPFIATLIATLLLSAAVGAFGYHAVARRGGPSWMLRGLFLLLAAVSGYALFPTYQFFS